MANGMIATRIRKNTAPTDAPPPIRRAMRHSRAKRARAGVMARLTCERTPESGCALLPLVGEVGRGVAPYLIVGDPRKAGQLQRRPRRRT